MPSNSTPAVLKRVRGWLFDVYPAGKGEVAVWIIGENGERVRLTDRFLPKVYVSGKQEDIERLASTFYASEAIAGWGFAYKFAHPPDAEKSRVLEVTLKDCRRIGGFTSEVLRKGDYVRFDVHNCDLRGDRMYLFENDLFPLARVDVEVNATCLRYEVLDNVERTDYVVPSLRILKLSVEVAKKGKICNFDDYIGRIVVEQAGRQVVIGGDGEAEKLLKLVDVVREFDPDIVLTCGGDSYLFPYLIHRASECRVLERFILSRDNTAFDAKTKDKGKTFFSYGRTFYRASAVRLFGRVHVDDGNTFAYSECGFDGVFEVARMCRMPLHTAARSSIGSSMSSMQFYQAVKDDMLIPRNKNLAEAFKSAYELLVGDRGGFVFEPRVGLHEDVGEVDFSSMYPSLMVKHNISAETVLCKCCPDSGRRIPELDYNICERRMGIVPKTLQLVVEKRQTYKRLRDETSDLALKEIYDRRQTALKWILVTCFGYLGYKNSKFGTIDGHIGVCAFGRDAFLRAARIAEDRGFTVLHGIVDSLWLKKPGATNENYRSLCRKITAEIGVSLNLEGRYRWIVFLPSKVHSRVGVMNRYFGIMDNGKVKLRGIDVRRGDTPRFVYEAQMDMLKVLAEAGSSKEFYGKIPEVLAVVREYRRRLLEGEVPIWDLVVSKHLSKAVGEYRQHVGQAIAAEQLIEAGGVVHAGGDVRFVFTDSGNRRPNRGVRAEPLIEKGVNADVRKYLLLLYASVASLLGFCGYTPQIVHDSVQGLRGRTLLDY